MEELMDVERDCNLFYCVVRSGEELAASTEAVEKHSSAASTGVAEGTSLSEAVRKVKESSGFRRGDDKVFGLRLEPPSWIDVTCAASSKVCKKGMTLHFKVVPAHQHGALVTSDFSLRRTFAVAQAVDKKRHYYVKSAEVADIFETMKQRRFLIVHGPSQSGKSSICLDILGAAKEENMNCIYIMLTSVVERCLNPDSFWSYLCTELQRTGRDILKVPSGIVSPVEVFRKMLIDCPPVYILMDDASYFSKLPFHVVSEFASVAREISQRRELYNVKSITLFGYYDIVNRFVMGQSAANGSITFPWSPERQLKVSRFSIAEILELLKQFQLDWQVEFDDVESIAKSVFSLTSGFKGLVGRCCGSIHDEASKKNFRFTHADWELLTRTPTWVYELIDGSTFMRYRAHIQVYEEEQRKILSDVLQFDIATAKRESVQMMIEDGILWEVSENAGDFIMVSGSANIDNMVVVKFSSPLLQALILRESRVLPTLTVIKPEKFTIHWMLDEAFYRMDLDGLLRAEGLNSDKLPSEYAYEYQFTRVVQNILLNIPEYGYNILVQARAEESGLSRLDVLLRHHTLPAYGFELQGNPTEMSDKDHWERSQLYASAHSCDMFLVSFFMNKQPLWGVGGRGHPQVTEMWVMFDSTRRTVSYGTYPSVTGVTKGLENIMSRRCEILS